MKIEIKRNRPLHKEQCLFCGNNRIMFDIATYTVYGDAKYLQMCKKCVMEMSYRLNEIIANELIKEDEND